MFCEYIFVLLCNINLCINLRMRDILHKCASVWERKDRAVSVIRNCWNIALCVEPHSPGSFTYPWSVETRMDSSEEMSVAIQSFPNAKNQAPAISRTNAGHLSLSPFTNSAIDNSHKSTDMKTNTISRYAPSPSSLPNTPWLSSNFATILNITSILYNHRHLENTIVMPFPPLIWLLFLPPPLRP